MKIGHPSELFYLAYTLKKRHSNELMFEADPKLLKGRRDRLTMLLMCFKKTDIYFSIDNKIVNEPLATDWVQWQRADDRFRQGRDAYYRWKTKDSGYLPHRENSFEVDQMPTTSDAHLELQSTLTSTYSSAMVTGKKKDTNYADYDKEFERLGDLHGICDRIIRETSKNDSNVFILTTYFVDNETVCSLSDVQPDKTYEHLCQYG